MEYCDKKNCSFCINISYQKNITSKRDADNRLQGLIEKAQRPPSRPLDELTMDYEYQEEVDYRLSVGEPA